MAQEEPTHEIADAYPKSTRLMRTGVLNGHVERAQRTHTEEFYEVTDLEWTLEAIRPSLRQWERVYNTVRPRQVLGYRTPRESLKDLARTG